jgi:Xaa-Pro aminopeptidase
MNRQQKDIYDVVLSAQKQAIDSVKPGFSFLETHELTIKLMAEGLADLGYIKDKHDPEQIKKYYMHGTGHSLGMDVHDVGVDKKTTKYVPGMVTTIEPGLYIAEKNIGVRIEDDVLVTPFGHEVLTQGLEK